MSSPWYDTWAMCVKSALIAFGFAIVAPLATGSLHAQATGTITGTVSNATSGESVAGAQISVAGTQLGALSNNVGRFVVLNVPAGTQTVQAQYIGFSSETQEVEVPAGGSVVVDFELSNEAISLEGVVVTGTAGASRRREIGNSISQLNTQELESAPVANLGQMLQGRTTGLTIQSNTGQVGAGETIRLRGNNSMTQGNDPLIYIDGVRMNSSMYITDPEVNNAPSPLNDINPGDIERVEVIKGAAATTLYGTEAAGGVIQIFTKRGASGAAAWRFSMDQGINNMGHVGPPEDVNPTGLGINDCTARPGCPESGSWLRNGHLQRYNMSVRGGSDQVNYFLSGSYGDEQGVLPEQGQTSYSLRGNFGFSPSENLNIRFNNSYTHKDIQWIPDGNNAEGFTLNVLRGDAGYTPGGDNSLVFDMDLGTLVDHFTSGVNVVWTPGNMSHRLNAGLDWSDADYTEERPWGFWYYSPGDREVDQEFNRKLTLDYSGTWSQDFGQDFSSSFSWGAQLYDDFRNRLNAFGDAFAGPGDKEIDSGATTTASETRRSATNGGFFLQEQVGFLDRLFLTAGLRVDGHSAFGDDFGLAPYPKVSGSYVISEEAFYPDSWGSLKLRAAYGESGKAPGFFDAEKTWEAVSGDEGQPGVEPSNLGNPELGPERTRELEFGFDGSTWENRISFEYTYYTQTTSDALVAVTQSPSTGFTGSQLENVGEIKNWGHEAMVNVGLVQGRDLSWDMDLRLSTNESEVIDLGGLEQIDLSWRNAIRPGEPLPIFCNEVVTNPNENADPIIEDGCKGPMFPTHNYGIGSSLNIGQRLTLDVLGEGQGGHFLSAGTAHQNTRREAWPTCFEIQEKLEAGQSLDGHTAVERARCNEQTSAYGIWTMPADFFKLRSVSASYRIPESVLPASIRGATLRLQGRNLWTSTDYEGLDPESHEDGGGLFQQEYYNLPPSRSFLMSVQLDF